MNSKAVIILASILELIEKAESESRDKKAKNIGFIVALSGELYTRTLGRNSAVYIERIGIEWEVWRESRIPEKKDPINFKVIATAKDFDYVLLKAKKYFGYIERKRALEKGTKSNY
ncbi:hypothetical protein V7157_15505 [Neobacillus drentensis]|uniref:hypothetical protein n=1 Tax=Neobacillus drentensis TaxID=220684 RepID=UPI0030030AB7